MRFARHLALTCGLMLILPMVSMAQEITIGVAASLKETLTDIAAAYQQKTGQKVMLTFGASGQILTQIKAGAPIDGFISAANKQVDDAIAGKLADPASHRVVCLNSLVLVVPADSQQALTSFESLSGLTGLLAVGEPKGVPAGQYAKQVLDKLHLTDKLADQIIYGASVRQVLVYVERGDVAAGIVYSTDALQSADKVRVVATADPSTHEPIVYPAVVLTGSKNPAATKQFLDFLSTPDAQAILKQKGFALSTAASPASQPAQLPTPLTTQPATQPANPSQPITPAP